MENKAVDVGACVGRPFVWSRGARRPRSRFAPGGEVLFNFLLSEGPTLVRRFQCLQCQIVPALLLRQPLSHRLAHDPALAPIDAISDLIHAQNEIARKLSSDYTPVVSHLTHQCKKIKPKLVSTGRPPLN